MEHDRQMPAGDFDKVTSAECTTTVSESQERPERQTPQSTELIAQLLRQLEFVDATINKMGGPRQEELLDFVNLIRCRVQPSEKSLPSSDIDTSRGNLQRPNIFGHRAGPSRQRGADSGGSITTNET